MPGQNGFARMTAQSILFVLQLGGSEPDRLAVAVRAVRDFHFEEINLNVGCPSPRVKAGCFGASLMAEPELVAKCVAAMQAETDGRLQ